MIINDGGIGSSRLSRLNIMFLKFAIVQVLVRLIETKISKEVTP